MGLFKKKGEVILPPPPLPPIAPASPPPASEAAPLAALPSVLPSLAPVDELPALEPFDFSLPQEEEMERAPVSLPKPGLPRPDVIIQKPAPPVVRIPAAVIAQKPAAPPVVRQPQLRIPEAKAIISQPSAPAKPFFVKVDDYRAILEGTTLIRNSLKEADEIIARLNELKNEGDREFEKWRAKVDDVQRKLVYVDKVLFEAG